MDDSWTEQVVVRRGRLTIPVKIRRAINLSDDATEMRICLMGGAIVLVFGEDPPVAPTLESEPAPVPDPTIQCRGCATWIEIGQSHRPPGGSHMERYCHRCWDRLEYA